MVATWVSCEMDFAGFGLRWVELSTRDGKRRGGWGWGFGTIELGCSRGRLRGCADARVNPGCFCCKTYLSTYTVANSDELFNVNGSSGSHWARARRRRRSWSQLRLRCHLQRRRLLLRRHRGHDGLDRRSLRLFGSVGLLGAGHCCFTGTGSSSGSGE